MSARVEEIFVEAAILGIKLRLDGEKVKAALPNEFSVRLEPVLEQLRNHRDEIRIALQRREDVPTIPRGVRLVSWRLKVPPVSLGPAAVVIDVHKFAVSTLKQLQAASMVGIGSLAIGVCANLSNV